MNKKEFARKFAEKYEVTQESAREMCYAVFELLSEQLDLGEDIYIYRLGTFKHETRKEKAVRHPRSGEMMTIPEKKVIVFKRSTKYDESEEDEE